MAEKYELVRDGGSHFFVIDRDGLPILEAVEYLGTLSSTPKSRLLICHTLVLVHNWLENEEISLYIRFYNSNPLQPSELGSLSNFLSLSESAKSSMPPVAKRVTRQTHAYRLSIAKKYLTYIADQTTRYLLTCRPDGYQDSKKLMEIFKSDLSLFSSSTKGVPSRQERNESFGKEKLKEIRQRIVGESSEIWSDAVRERNLIIVLIMIETGLRIGMIAKLDVSDVDGLNSRAGKVTLIVRPGGGEETKFSAASTATNKSKFQIERTLGIETSKLLRIYVDGWRARALKTIKKKIQNPYLFVTAQGNPRRKTGGESAKIYHELSMASIRHLCGAVGNHFNVKFNPHSVKRTYSDALNSVRSTGGQLEDDAFNYLLGHVAGSLVSDRYAIKDISETMSEKLHSWYEGRM